MGPTANEDGLAGRSSSRLARYAGALTLVLGIAWPVLAQAAPLDDKIQLLRSRPTGMEEDEWRIKRREAAKDIGDIRDDRAVDALIHVVETERYDAVLSVAIEGLGKQGDRRALPTLQAVHADRSIDTFIREQAADAIKKLGDTPRDDARLVGGDVGPSKSTDGVVTGPQIGTMGAAAAPADDIPEPKRRRDLPKNLVARDRAFDFVIGAADLSVNTRWQQHPFSIDADGAVTARYTDERTQWGWSANGVLGVGLRNGDFETSTSLANDAQDGGNLFYLRQHLAGSGEVHYYFGKSRAHIYADVGLSERLTVATVQNDLDDMDGVENESDVSDSRFALDVAPAGGFGFGRYLNAGSDLMMDAFEAVLAEENILARPLDREDRKAIQVAIFNYANDRASYPRVAQAIALLQDGGYLVRAPSPRLVYRLIRVIDDPSYVDRPKGPLVRVGFVFGVPLVQGDFLRRNNGTTPIDSMVAGPIAQFDMGIQLSLEREIIIDTRVLYDALGDVTGFSTDTGVTYRRHFHGRWSDYLGSWYAGIRGGASKRNFELPDGFVDEALGYRAMGLAGYTYAFNRGSRIDVGVQAGVESNAFIVGAGLGFRFGIARGSVIDSAAAYPREKKKQPKAGEGQGTQTEADAAGTRPTSETSSSADASAAESTQTSGSD